MVMWSSLRAAESDSTMFMVSGPFKDFSSICVCVEQMVLQAALQKVQVSELELFFVVQRLLAAL